MILSSCVFGQSMHKEFELPGLERGVELDLKKI